MIDIDELVRETYFPRMDVHFSNKENPLAIVRSMDKYFAVLRQELLYLWFTMEDTKPNDKQTLLLGGSMLRLMG